MDGTPGWYGKLPSLGDFASRRLPPHFVEPWDAWLAQGLAAWRDSSPDWLAAYLAAPSWCFVLGPEVLPPAPGASRPGPAWAGVLMPSVDRVGRYFPLTIAGPVQSLQGISTLRLAHWLTQAAARAVDALQQDWGPDRLDEALGELGDLTWPNYGRDDGASPIADALERVVRQGDAVLWWLPGASADTAFRQSTGLPIGPAFARLLGGPAADVPAA
jgi:type VI secretion system protein ImpM